MDRLGSDQAPRRTTATKCADGDVGELFSRTPYAFDGYWKNPEKTAEAFRGAWCLGRRHGAPRRGRLLSPGRPQEQHDHQRRREHLSVRGGGVLGAHPEVQDVAVDRHPATRSGANRCMRSWCCTTARRPEAELLDWCRDRMAGYKRPRAIEFIEEAQMPRTATGKIRRRRTRRPAPCACLTAICPGSRREPRRDGAVVPACPELHPGSGPIPSKGRRAS